MGLCTATTYGAHSLCSMAVAITPVLGSHVRESWGSSRAGKPEAGHLAATPYLELLRMNQPASVIVTARSPTFVAVVSKTHFSIRLVVVPLSVANRTWSLSNQRTVPVTTTTGLSQRARISCHTSANIEMARASPLTTRVKTSATDMPKHYGRSDQLCSRRRAVLGAGGRLAGCGFVPGAPPFAAMPRMGPLAPWAHLLAGAMSLGR